MVIIWVRFLHKRCWSISQLVTGKISGQLDLSTLSYGQMTKYYSFGHFAQADCRSPGLGKTFGQLGLVFWAFFLHQSCDIMCLVLYPIGLAPIEPPKFMLLLPKPAGLMPSPTGHQGQPQQTPITQHHSLYFIFKPN